MVRVLAALVGASLLLGCGSSPTPEREKVAETAETYLQTCANQDASAALNVLTPPVRKKFLDAPSTVEACRETLGFELEPLQRVLARQVFEESRVVDVRLHGDYASVVIEQPQGKRSEVELESSGDRWLLADPRRPPFAP